LRAALLDHLDPGVQAVECGFAKALLDRLTQRDVARDGSGLAGGTFRRSATGMHFMQRAVAVAKTDAAATMTAAEMINGPRPDFTKAPGLTRGEETVTARVGEVAA
jgi:hypothetical protein